MYSMKSFFILLKILKNFVEIQYKKKKKKGKWKKKTYIFVDIHAGILQIWTKKSGLKNGYIIILLN